MKEITGCLTILSVILVLYFSAIAQSDLEKKIERIFLYQPQTDSGENYDVASEIDKLGSMKEARDILLNMVGKYKHAEPGTREYLLLAGATRVLGEISEKKALPLLSSNLFDQAVHENIRAFTARALGQIDLKESKQLLLKALENRTDYFAIRTEAAEALANIKDPEVLKTLEKHAREEGDSYAKQKFEKAAQDLRARIQRPR
jgi:HEAT repeat protein